MSELFLKFLYHTIPGRACLKLFAGKFVSEGCGRFLDSSVSRCLIRGFVRRNAIRCEDYEQRRFTSFNDFFTRQIRAGLRPVDHDPDNLIAPCDGYLSAYRLSELSVIPVKQSRYTVSELLGGDERAARFRNGICLVFRLGVNNYHRYCYADSGVKGENIYIPGVLHTVRPIALEKLPVFIRNCREFTELTTERFGHMIQMEVGALLVGKIQNYDGAGSVIRGQEKGKFLYGGSTVILLLEKDAVKVHEQYFLATALCREVPVQMGQVIGHALRASAPAER